MRSGSKVIFAGLLLGHTLKENKKHKEKPVKIPVDISFDVGQKTTKHQYRQSAEGLVVDDPKM